MDNQALEQRLARIEEHLAKLDERLTKLDRRTVRAWEMLDIGILKIDLRLEEVEVRLKEFPEVERIAQEAYLKTHPDAQAGLQEVSDAVETVRGQIFFSNLPTVKDYRHQSKS
jgi:hypothetical protein